jgi:carbon monoxide dehydrogenase subunit G
MHLEHEFVVAASFEETWRFLLEPERVASCLPGVTLDSVGGNVFAGRWKVKVGPVSVTYRGTARLVENDVLTGTLVLEASGKESRGDGTAQATTRIRVTGAGGVTRIAVYTDVKVTGRAGDFELDVLARAGDKIFERFAACAAESIGADQPAPPVEQPLAHPVPQPAAAAAEAGPASRPVRLDDEFPSPGREPGPDDQLGLLAPPIPRSSRWVVAVGAALTALGLAWRQRRHSRNG